MTTSIPPIKHGIMTNLGCKLQSLSEQQSAKRTNQPKSSLFSLESNTCKSS